MAVRGYDFLISGKSLASVPAWIPVVFEMTILLASLAHIASYVGCPGIGYLCALAALLLFLFPSVIVGMVMVMAMVFATAGIGLITYFLLVAKSSRSA